MKEEQRKTVQGLLSVTEILYGENYEMLMRRVYNLISKVPGRAFTSPEVDYLRLVFNNFIEHGLYAERKDVEAAYERAKKWKPISDTPPEMVEQMKKIGAMSRQKLFIQRLRERVVWSVKHNETIIMNTLTASQQNIRFVFEQESNAWKHYYNNMMRKFGRHEYFAVIEAGAKRGRLHYHVLHFFSGKLDLVDPNLIKAVPTHVLVPEIEPAWQYGLSEPRLVRWAGDIYDQSGWRWPLEEKRGEWVPVPASPLAVVHYVGGYVAKELNNPERTKIAWRTKTSRNLGYQRIDKALEPLTIPQTAQVVTVEQTRRNREIHLLLKKRSKSALAAKLKSANLLDLGSVVSSEETSNLFGLYKLLASGRPLKMSEVLNIGLRSDRLDLSEGGSFDPVVWSDDLAKDAERVLRFRVAGSHKR